MNNVNEIEKKIIMAVYSTRHISFIISIFFKFWIPSRSGQSENSLYMLFLKFIFRRFGKKTSNSVKIGRHIESAILTFPFLTSES